MSIFRRARVEAVVDGGFLAREARALQTSMRTALSGGERSARRPVPVELVIDAGQGDLLVVVCRNLVVGFVPEERTASLAPQLAQAGKARLVVPGRLYPDGDLWRVWVGAVPADGLPAAPRDLDRLAAPKLTVFGVPLQRLG